MYKKFLIGGVTAAAIVGVAGTSLAVTGSDTTNGSASTSKSSTASTAKHAKKDGKKHGDKGLLRGLEHGQFVTKTKKATTTHDLIRGTATAVSATSITVQAADKKSETFTITKATKVRVRENGKGAASSIGKVAKGDRVFVAGTGTTTFTAKQVVDVKGTKK